MRLSDIIIGVMIVVTSLFFLAIVVMVVQGEQELVYSVTRPEGRDCSYFRPGQWFCDPVIPTPQGVLH